MNLMTECSGIEDRKIISSIVKGRELCRQLVQGFMTVRASTSVDRSFSVEDVSLLRRIEKAVSGMLLQLRSIPQHPCEAVRGSEERRYVSELLSEISEMVETAVVLEREVRQRMPRKNPGDTADHSAGRFGLAL